MGQRAWGRGQRAEGMGHGAEGMEHGAEGMGAGRQSSAKRQIVPHWVVAPSVIEGKKSVLFG